ncbi:MAG: hypothetical protein ACT4QC_20235 [Planctomycetaceae bacterium]
MEPTHVETELVRKLAADWHLNVPERRSLPAGGAKAGLLLNAIEDELRSGGWYPAGARPDDDFDGGLIERMPDGTCRIHWKSEVSFCRYELDFVQELNTPREAATTFLKTVFNDGIDGIPIDWEGVAD